MLSQAQTGQPSASGNGVQVPLRAGALGDQIMSELHGRYYEQNYQGNVFFGGHTSLIALSANTITLTSTTTPILGVYNPVGSGKNMVMLQAALNLISNNLTSGAGPGALVWAMSTGNTTSMIASGSAPINAKSLSATGSVGRSFAGNQALTSLTTNLSIICGSQLPTPSGLTYTTLASTALLPSYSGREDFDGLLIVPPGGVLALLNTTSSTVFSAVGRLSWEEVPV